MSFNSVNTNRQAVFALQSLNLTNSELGGVQKRVSTGFRVADARDDGGAFAVAQAVRSDVAGVTAVGEQLGGTRGILSTTFASLSVVSDTMKQVRAVMTRMADAGITGTSREQYEEQYTLLTNQIATFIDDAFYNGRTLLSTSVAEGGGNITSIRNESGGTFEIESVDGSELKLDPDAFLITPADLTALTTLAETNYTAALPPGGPAWATLTAAVQQTYIDAEIFNEKVDRATTAIQSGGDFE